jgi:SAM-dependent MidA family methyltransferase
MPAPAPHTKLPALSAAEQAHAAQVLTAVRVALAAAGGWLSFAEYLQLVMYAPGLGYYSAGATKLGAAGDFITAPELSSLFGYCVARHCAPVLAALARAGGEPEVIELGAGSGQLAVDVLTRLATLGALPARYGILEVSADLRARQQARIATLPAELRSRVHWLESLPATPLRAVIIANEVADALPFERFEVTAAGVVPLGVALDYAGALAWRAGGPDAALLREYQRLTAELPGLDLPAGYRSEHCPLLDGWIAALAATLEAGLILLVDYGVGRRDYYHAERTAGTLRCHFRHRAHDDPFLHPGLQDITAWVDFTRVAEAATAAGLELAGYCTQAAFLLGAGIDQELRAAAEAADTQRGTAGGSVAAARNAAAARQMLLPGEMGETFKAIALARGLPASLGGFTMQDVRRTL